MDKALSIGSAVVLASLMLFAAWLFSGGPEWTDGRQQPLAEVLRQLGGPLGFWGGALLVAAMAVSVYGLHELGNLWAGRAFIRALRRRGVPPESMAARIDALPVSRGLKLKMKAEAGKVS